MKFRISVSQSFGRLVLIFLPESRLMKWAMMSKNCLTVIDFKPLFRFKCSRSKKSLSRCKLRRIFCTSSTHSLRTISLADGLNDLRETKLAFIDRSNVLRRSAVDSLDGNSLAPWESFIFFGLLVPISLECEFFLDRDIGNLEILWEKNEEVRSPKIDLYMKIIDLVNLTVPIVRLVYR